VYACPFPSINRESKRQPVLWTHVEVIYRKKDIIRASIYRIRMAPMRARKPAATEPERAAAPLPGTTVALALAVGVGEAKVPVLLEPAPEPALPVPVALEPEPVAVGLASRELCEPGRPEPTPGLPPAREVGRLTLVLLEPLEVEPEAEAEEPEPVAVEEGEAELEELCK
jgi:hypothetical protein